MEVFKCNKNNVKWYKKINWAKILLIFVISFFVFYFFFYYISSGNDLNKIVFTSIVISLLISLYYVLSDLIENRDRIFFINKRDLGYIEIHKELSGKFLSSSEFDKIIRKEDIEEIYLKNYLYEGIDKGIIKSIKYAKKKSNCIVLKANVEEKVWKSTSRFTISKIYLTNRKRIKKIIIPNDYEEYNKLYKIIKERIDKNV